MERAREDAVIAALNDLEQGHTIEEILDRYPQHEAELRPILETATGLSGLQSAPSNEARRASRQRLLAEAQRLRVGSHRENSRPRWQQFFYSFASFALVLVLLGAIVIPAADDAIPGDILYPVKRSAESVQLFLAPAHEKEELLAEFVEERNHEVYEMVELGRDGEAGYVGIIKAIGPDYWEIGRITANIDDSTVITGEPEVGARVEAHCLVRDGEVIAESLTVLESAQEMRPATP